MSGIITGREFIDTFPACDAAVQGASRAALLQATYVALYEIGCLVGAVIALFYGNSASATFAPVCTRLTGHARLSGCPYCRNWSSPHDHLRRHCHDGRRC